MQANTVSVSAEPVATTVAIDLAKEVFELALLRRRAAGNGALPRYPPLPIKMLA